MGRWVHSGTRGFTGERVRIVGFIRVRVAGAPRGRQVHSRSLEFTLAHLGGVGFSRIRLGQSRASMGSSEERLRVVRFIRVRVGLHGRALWSSGSFGFARAHSGAPRGRRVLLGSRWFTPASLGVVSFIRVGVGSLGWALGSSGSFAFAWVH